MEKINRTAGELTRIRIWDFLTDPGSFGSILEENPDSVLFECAKNGPCYEHFYESSTLQDFVDWYNVTFIGSIRINSKNELERI